jgi:hypothetical protein
MQKTDNGLLHSRQIIAVEHTAELAEYFQLLLIVRPMHRIKRDFIFVVGSSDEGCDLINECEGIGLHVFIEKNERLVRKIFFDDLNFVEVIQIAVMPGAAVVFNVEKFLERFIETILYKAAVLRCDPAIVPAKHDNNFSIGMFCGEPFYFLLKLLVKLIGNKNALLL